MRVGARETTAIFAMAALPFVGCGEKPIDIHGVVIGYDLREAATIEAPQWQPVEDAYEHPREVYRRGEYRDVKEDTIVECDTFADDAFQSSDDGECWGESDCLAGPGQHCEVIDRETRYDYERKVWKPIADCTPPPIKHELHPVEVRRNLGCVDRHAHGEIRIVKATQYIVYITYQLEGKNGELQPTQSDLAFVEKPDDWRELQNGDTVNIRVKGGRVTVKS